MHSTTNIYSEGNYLENIETGFLKITFAWNFLIYLKFESEISFKIYVNKNSEKCNNLVKLYGELTSGLSYNSITHILANI